MDAQLQNRPRADVPFSSRPAVQRLFHRLAEDAHRRKLRVALFSGNFNYHRDGANMTLNRLVGFLVRLDIPVRVYSPTGAEEAFPAAGPLVSVPSVPIPRRPEYRFSLGMPASVRADLQAFAPSLVHVSAPDLLGRSAQRFAQAHRVPIVASYHTRFETYLRYYGLQAFEGTASRYIRRFYNRCAQVLVPSDSVAQALRAQTGHHNVRIWSRGVDRETLTPDRRSHAWRRQHGVDARTVLIGFTGRLVLEKGLAQLIEVAARMRGCGVPHRFVIVGDGPERLRLEHRLPDAIFTGFLTGAALADAYANMDIFYNPSTTESFGNVTLEAMASGVPTVAMRDTGADALVVPGITGLLVSSSDPRRSIEALTSLCASDSMRQAMACAARVHSARYDWDDILGTVLANYLDALPQRP